MSEYQPPHPLQEEDEEVNHASRPASRSAPISVPLESSAEPDEGCARWGAALIIMAVLGVLAIMSYQMRAVYFPALAPAPPSPTSHVSATITNTPILATPGQSGYVIPQLSIRCHRSQGVCHFAVETPVLVSATIAVGQATECILTTTGSAHAQQGSPPRLWGRPPPRQSAWRCARFTPTPVGTASYCTVAMR